MPLIKIQVKNGIIVEQQTLIHDGNVLQDMYNLAHYGITDKETDTVKLYDLSAVK